MTEEVPHLAHRAKQQQHPDHFGPRHCHTYSDKIPLNDEWKQHYVKAIYVNLRDAIYHAMRQKNQLTQKKRTNKAGPLRHRHQKTKRDYQRHRQQAQNAREGED